MDLKQIILQWLEELLQCAMPTSSVFDHQMVKDKNLFSKLNASKYQDKKIYHMRGKDISGKII